MLRTICDMGVGGPGLTPVELGGHGPGVLCPGPDLQNTAHQRVTFVKRRSHIL